MTLAGTEDRHVCPTTSASHENGKVRRHVLYGDSVLVEQRANDALPHYLLGRLLDFLRARYEVEDESVANRLIRYRSPRRSNQRSFGSAGQPGSALVSLPDHR